MVDLLSVTWGVDPYIFSIGNFHLKWYSVLFVAGLYPIGYFIMKSFYKREGIPTETLDPLLYALLIGTFVGARLGHVLFYDPVYYFSHPWKILMTWEGGLASHGGAIGVLLAVWWYVHRYGKKNGFSYIWVIDRLVIAICFAGMLIRLGNLFNSEIYGHQTDLPWGFVFTLRGETVPKHPTQLYEALCYCLLGLFLLWLYLKKLPRLHTGTIFGIFLIGLFGARFLIEFVKEPQEAFEEGMLLNMGQLLSIPFIIAGVIILVWSIRKGSPAAAHGPVPSGDKGQGTGRTPKGKTPLTHVKSTNAN
ncbi:MAG TPA: prolipoprotein diacylglyceryl transferase [Candidatus Coprenecus stercoripullorum]|nr:prolipoprotein diacylglyceryl transferase [Candidatus Coprenecus stercoripullorum]